MKISYNWLKKYIDIHKTPEEISTLLTFSGLEIEHLEKTQSMKGGLEGMVVGEVLEKKKHENADKLSVTKVDIGTGEPLQIVCGAPNVEAGQKVIVATVGSTLYPIEGESFKINKSKIRGEVSEGMICAEDEIGLGKSHAGIMVLPAETKVGMSAKEFFNVTEDYIFEVAITANRGDATSHLGVARDLSALCSIKLNAFSEDKLKQNSTEKVFEIDIQNKNACPRYSGIYLKNITVKESPDWLKQSLLSIDIQPINNVVDATNYVLHSIGQPIHAFDADKITDKKIIVRNAVKDEVLKTLDGVERKLQGHELVIANPKKAMALAGVFGGEDSGIKNETKNIFIESAYFDATTIRKGAKAHNLNTDASFRYERGADPEICVKALTMVSNLILEIAGGEIASEITDVYPEPLVAAQVNLRWNKITEITGTEIPREKTKEIITYIGIEILEENKEGLLVKIPLFKSDVTREIDVIEEIIRLYGFDKVETSLRMNVSINPTKKPDENAVYNSIAALLNAQGYSEMVNNSLVSTEFPYRVNTGEAVKLLNPLSTELEWMRPEMIFGGLQSIAYNKNRKNNDLRLFELGKTYLKKEGKYIETKYLSCWVTGNIYDENWKGKKGKVDFYEVKKNIQQIFQLLQIKWDENAVNYGAYNPDALVSIEQVPTGILKYFDIRSDVFYAQIHWKKMMKLVSKHKVTYTEISKFPEVQRDLSFVIDKKVTYAEIENTIKNIKLPALQNIQVFDVYEGDKLEQNKKAYALSFTFSDTEKTLTDKEIEKMMDRIISEVSTKNNALVRK